MEIKIIKFILDYYCDLYMKYSLEDIIDHFSYEGLSLNRTQLRGLIDLYEPTTGELVGMEPTFKDWVARHLFNKNEQHKYYNNKDNDFVFAELVLNSYY